MNQRTTYEITIADKLGQLRMPELKDAIWSRIEDQLDTDMPTDDNPPSPDSPGFSSFTKRFGLFAVIVAAVTILLISKKDKPSPVQQNNTTTSGQSSPGNENNINNNNSGPPPAQRYNTSSPVINNNAPGADTSTLSNGSDPVFTAPLFVPPVVKDTTPLVSGPPPAVTRNEPPLHKQDSVPPKKSKGFKGLTSDDYRISLKKDSVP